jgi:hypothetical protein
MKDRDSERKGSCIKRLKEKKHAQIKELTDWAFPFPPSFRNFLAIILYFIPKSYHGHNIQPLLLLSSRCLVLMFL